MTVRRGNDGSRGSLWNSWWRGLVSFCEAADTSTTEFQDLRIERIESRMIEVEKQLAAGKLSHQSAD